MKHLILFLTAYACLAFCLPEPAAAQKVERVYPSYNHSSLYGVVATDDGRLYAAGSNSVLLESMDEGTTWRTIPLGTLELHIHTLATDGASLFMLAASPQRFGMPQLWPEGYHSQLFRYDPVTERIEHLPFPVLQGPDSSQTISRYREFCLAVTRQALYLSYIGNDAAPLLLSRDGGNSWSSLDFPEAVTGRRLYPRTRAMSDDILVFRYDGSTGTVTLYFSTDFGASWRDQQGPSPSSPVSLLWLRDGRVLLQARTDGELKLMAVDGSWTSLGPPPFGDIVTMAEDAQGAWIALTEKGECYRSEDEGRNWVRLLPERLGGGFQRSMAQRIVTPDERTMIIADDHGSILRSTDRGLTWDTPRALDIFVDYAYMADSAFGIAMVRDFKADTREDFYSYRLTDDGFRTLQPCPDLPLSRVFPVTRSLWYAVGWSGSYSDSILCRSTDGGQTWELVLELPGVVAFTTPVEVYEDNAWALATSQGIMYTSDRGETWEHIYVTEWTGKAWPRKIIIPGRGKPIWMIPDRSNPFIVLRSDETWQRWDTVLVFSQEERDLVVPEWGITDIGVTTAGQVYTFALTRSGRSNGLIHFSADNGASWQSWLAERDMFEKDDMALHNLLLRSGESYVAHLHQKTNLSANLHSVTISLSRDQMRSFDIVFEHGINQSIMEVRHVFPSADRRYVFFTTGMAVYRIAVPDMTSGMTERRPPLPLSIDTPHPHPLTRQAGGAMLFIQSERPALVRLHAYAMTGRLVAVLYDGYLAPEGRHVSWHTANLAPGLYMLRLSSADGVSSRKVLLR